MPPGGGQATGGEPQSNDRTGFQVDRFFGAAANATGRLSHGGLLTRTILRNGDPNAPAGVAGAVVEPGRLRVPAFVAVPGRDRIVPPESARPLVDLIPGAVLHSPAAGHVGMVAGGRAERVLWRPLSAWIATL